MLVLYEKNSPLPLDDYCILHKENGLDELEFTISTALAGWQELYEETRILETSEQICYLVKALQSDGDSASVRCQIDLNDWRDAVLGDWSGSTHTPWETSSARTVLQYLHLLADPIGWQIEGDTENTPSLQLSLEGPTRLDAALELEERSGLRLRFDNRNRVVTLVDPALRGLSDSYAAPDVNLRELCCTGDSKSFATRLYAVGRDGLTFSSLNGGLPYIEDHSYSADIICAFLQDERCTTAEELLAAAQTRLKSLAVPQRSWQCRVTDLYRLSPETWKDLSLSLFTVLRVMDVRKGLTLTAQVVEDKVYPCYPHKNEITVSSVPGGIQHTVRTLSRLLNDRNSAFWQQLQSR